MNEFDTAARQALNAPANAGAPETPFDSVAAQVLQTQRGAAGQNLLEAQGSDPDKAARAMQLSRQTGVPQPAIEADLPLAEQAQQVERDSKVLEQSPGLTGFLGGNPLPARMAHDDVGTLGAIEASITKAAKYLLGTGDKGSFLGDLAGGAYFGGGGAAAGAFRAVAEQLAAGAEGLVPALRFNEQAGIAGGNPLRRLAEGFGMIAADSQARMKLLSPPDASIVGGGVSSGVQSLGQNLMMLPLALLPGGQGAALTGMSAQAGGQSYSKARELGVNPNTALVYGLSDAAIEYATEKLPLEALIGGVKAGAPLWKSLVKNAALEVPGEQIATVLQDMNEWAILNPQKTVSEFLAERPAAAAQTLIATLIGVGGQVSLVHAAQAAGDKISGIDRKAQDAEGGAKTLEELVALAESSKLRERDPVSFQAFMQEVAEANVPNLYVDAAALQQAGVLQEVVQAFPSIAPQVAQAISTGGDIVIPTAEFATAAPGQTFAQALIDNARISEDGMSRVEAQAYMTTHAEEVKGEVQRVLDEQQLDNDFNEGRDQVRDIFAQRLDAVKRFTPDVNQAYATMLGSFYATTASKLGLSPDELVQRYPLHILGESRGPQADALVTQRKRQSALNMILECMT